MRVVGLVVASGKLFYGVAEGRGAAATQSVAGAPTDLVPSQGGSESARLADFQARFRQDLRSISPSSVGLVATRKHGNWQYRQAFDRISLVAAVMLACEQEGVSFQEVKTEDIARVVKLPAHGLEQLSPSAVGLDGVPLAWRAGRAAAFGCAMTLLENTAEEAGT